MEHKLKEWVRGFHEKFGEVFTKSSDRVSRKVRRDFYAEFAKGFMQSLRSMKA
jgi:hypothetical protein